MPTPACNHRIVIYAKDVMDITGKERKASYRLLKKIRAKYTVSKEALITIDHFCQFTGIREARVTEFLK